MKRFLVNKLSFAGVLASALFLSSAQAGQFFQDFSTSAIGATNFNDDSQLFTTDYSVAQVVFAPYNELQLTANGISGTYSAYELPDLDSGTPVYAFSAKWNMPVYGNFPNSADGFSLNFGQLGSLPLPTNSTYTLESGYGVGLSFDVQTYSGNNPGFYIRANGNIVASLPYNPATQWGTNNGTRHFFEVDWNYYTGMSARMDGTNIFSNVAVTNFTPAAGDRFVFAARCGGLSEFIRLDNIAVLTGGNLVQLPAGSPYFGTNDSGSVRSAAFDGNDSTYWSALSLFPDYIGATFSPSNPVSFYALTADSLASRSSDPQTFTLDGSDNNGSSWTTLASGNAYFQNPMETHCCLGNPYTLGHPAYRLNITAALQPNSGCRLGELRLYSSSQVAAPYAAFLKRKTAGFTGVATTTNGSTLWACSSTTGQGIWSSTNYGVSWTQSSAPTGYPWYCIACDAAGDTIYAGGANGPYCSTDHGATWSALPLSGTSYAVACSADGAHVVFARAGTYLYRSDNGGSFSELPNGPTGSTAVAMSADGSTVIANNGSTPSTFYFTGGGGGWIAVPGLPAANWKAVWINPVGGDVYAVSTTGVYWSYDLHTWTQTSSQGWSGYTLSADETFIASISSGSVYTRFPTDRATPPAPTLAINSSGNNSTFAWPAANGGNFALQQSSSLSAPHWTNVFWPVTSDGNTFQVTVPHSGSSSYYRLKSQ